MIEYTNSQISQAIDEYIHNAQYREIMKSRLIDGLTHEDLAEIYNYSVRQIKRIVYKNQKIIYDKI